MERLAEAVPLTPPVEELFHQVADLSEDARARFLDEREIDPGTRREVEALVAFDAHSNTVLQREIGQVATRALERLEPVDLLCGAFRLKELLGRGGMGAVYLAERVDGEVAQQVAIKLLRPGGDDPQLRRRFLEERRILAPLSHPHIARLLDAGHRADGQPYLAMEYVKGKRIDVYTAALGVRHKVALFLKLCTAISYLHRNLVVHRDLKPSNILVTEDGEPKLLDFGVAKILDITTDATVTCLRMLTPDYASPEQVAGRQVTTATDIYSLGAVLYKLLTGEGPHQFEGDSPASIALAISGAKIVPPSKLAPGIKNDLEMILLKALRSEPQERYASVDHFAEDLENFLESRPIRARKGDAWYRTRKFVRRRWLPVAAATLAVASLSAGLALANHERTTAQRRFAEVRQLANKLFDIDIETRKVTGTTKVRQLIVDTSLEYLQRLSADAKGDPDLALEVGNAYMRVARVQGVPISQNLGQMDQAEQNLKNAETFLQSALKANPRNRTAMLRSAQIAHDRMLLARYGSRYPESLEFARQSAAWLEKFNAGLDDQTQAPAILVTYLNVSDQHMLGRQFDDALRLCRRGAELARSYNSPVYVGTMLWVSAEVFRRQGDLDAALRDITESVRAIELGSSKATDGGLTMNLVLALTYQGKILGDERGINMGRSQDALVQLERAFDLADNLAHLDSSDQNSRGRLEMSGRTMANILWHSDPPRALAIYDHVLRHMSEIKNNSGFRRYEVSMLAGSTYPLRRLGRVTEARQRLDDAFERLRQIKAYPAAKIKPGSEPDTTLSALADYEAEEAHNLPRAIEIYTELLEKVLAYGAKSEIYLTDAVDVSRLYGALATLYDRTGQRDLRSIFEGRRLALWRHWDSRLPNNNFVRRHLNLALGRVSHNLIASRGQVMYQAGRTTY